MRIFIACADEGLRLALLMLMDQNAGMVVVGMSDRSKGLLILVGTLQPELLLLDDDLDKEATVDLVRDLHLLEYPPKIIILSINPQRKHTILAAGADGFISKNMPPDELLPIIRKMNPPETKLKTSAGVTVI
jgi:DNA-binding NarL/FixJ family response regulator